MDDEFLQGLLALHPDWYERYARRAAAAGARGAHTDTEVRAIAGTVLQDSDGPEWDAIEGTRFPRPLTVNGVAILPLYGLLATSLPWYQRGTSTEAFAMQLLAALDDSSVREIVIRIDSPGGTALGCSELADLIYRSRERKPITAFVVNGMMCSAAYCIGSAAGKIYATVSSEIGSIGVIWAHYDLTGMAEQAGVKVSLLAIPQDKAIGYDQKPMTDADKAKLVATWLQPCYTLFVDTVARNRAVSADKVKSDYGRGLTFLAAQAAEVGMIDGVRDWHEFLQGLVGRQAAIDSMGGSEDPPQFLKEERQMKFSAKLKAIMLAAGILETMDADDAVCAMAFRVWCTARGETVPTEEDAAFALVRGSLNQAAKPQTLPAQTAPPPAAVAPQVDVQAEVARALAAESARQSAIRTRAALLTSQLGLDVPEQEVQAALGNQTITAERFSEQVLASAQQTNRPVGRIENGPAALDKFTSAAATAILMRAGPDLARTAAGAGANQTRAAEQAQQLTQGQAVDQTAVRQVAGMSWLQIAQESVRLSGRRPQTNSDEAWATAFLQMAGDNRLNQFAVGHPGIEGGLMQSAPIHGPGNFPNLMGLVAQQTSYFAINVAPVSYWRWATRHDDALNFNPQEILQFYGSTRLDEHVDTHPPGQASFNEQAAWIQVNQYSKGAKLSSRMIIQNQLSTFLRMLVQFQIAVERTVNELVVNHLISNTACPFDGVALFHNASHANDRTSGNPPSIDENKQMRILLAQQTIPGDSLEAGLTFDFALYGSENINAAELQYLPAYRVVPASQSDVNQFTGRVEPIYEPLLSAGDPVWYAGSRSPMVVGILYSFLAGSGPGGRRVTYFDPATQCQSFDYYVEAGSALVNYQPYARNAGTGAT